MFLYGGLEQEEYQQIKDDIAEYNRRCLMVTNVLTLGLMITSVIASLFLFALDSFLTMLYTGYLFADIVMLTAATFALKQDRRMITPFVWICIAVLYSYAVMTTVINPASQATTMMVCLAVIPVIFALRPAESVPLTIAMAYRSVEFNRFLRCRHRRRHRNHAHQVPQPVPCAEKPLSL